MARSFNGTSQFLSNANTPVTVVPLTLAAWAYKIEAGAGTVLSVGAPASANTFALEIFSDEKVDNAIQASGAASFATTTTALTLNTWNHCAAVYRSATSRDAYLNGGGKGSNTTSRIPVDIAVMRIAERNAGSPTNLLEGYVAEAAIWDTDLSDAEIVVLATGVSPLLVRPGNIVAYWPLVGRTDPEIDVVGKYDMSLTASPATVPHPRIIRPRSRLGVFVPTAAVGGRIFKLAGIGGGLVGPAKGLAG